MKSEPKYAKDVNLNGQAWVDALHMESEIPGFYTRYLATVKQDIGILVTYSINKAKYQDYLNDFDKMVRTLKVFRKSGGINVAPQSSDLFKNAQIPSTVSSETIFSGGGQPIQGGADSKPAKSKSDDDTLLYLGLAIAGIVGFLIWKKRRSSDS